MKIYKHEGAGHYIGSCVIVVSDSEDSARKMIHKILDANGLNEELLCVSEIEIKNNLIIHIHNGDY